MSCNCTYGDLLFIQVGSEPTKMHCTTGLGNLHSPLFNSAMQNRLTAGLCHCNCTYGDLLFIQVCSEPTEMHCSICLGKMQSPLFNSALQNRLTAGLCHAIAPMEICSSYRWAVSQQKCTAPLVLLGTAHTPMRFCSFDQQCCTDTRPEPMCMLLAPVLL